MGYSGCTWSSLKGFNLWETAKTIHGKLLCVATGSRFNSHQWWVYSQAFTKPCDIILALRAKREQWEPSSAGLVGRGCAGTVLCPSRTHGRCQLGPSVGHSCPWPPHRVGFGRSGQNATSLSLQLHKWLPSQFPTLVRPKSHLLSLLPCPHEIQTASLCLEGPTA